MKNTKGARLNDLINEINKQESFHKRVQITKFMCIEIHSEGRMAIVGENEVGGETSVTFDIIDFIRNVNIKHLKRIAKEVIDDVKES
jgi:hypothetical protein